MEVVVDLSRVKDREGLKAQREPHWQRLRPGCFLGYRPSAREGSGTWIARAYDETSRKYRLKALGGFGGLASRDQFAAAKVEAEAFALAVERGSIAEKKVETVADACRAFAADRPNDEARFRRFVYDDDLGKVKLGKLRRGQVEAWRQRIEANPALVSRSKTGERITRPRSLSTINRDMAVLRTALGRYIPVGSPNTEAAWQEPLKPIKDAGKRRTLYLDRDQRRALLAHIDAGAEPFVRALCLLPLRPGALAALTAGSFDQRTHELTIGKDKAGNGRRILLPPDATALLLSQSKGKLPGAPLFMRPNGKAWDKETWKKPIAAAVKAAGVPTGATAYTLRHSTITDLVSAGLPLLTVAQISGTSADMIEQHYGHLGRSAAVEALAGLAL
jgi:integrase